MGLTYRSVKGSALTITELDNNFRYLTGSNAITGSLIVSNTITASYFSGDGSGITGVISASYATSASHEIIKEISSSYADVAGGLTEQPSIYITNLTASSNISSSGTITANQLQTDLYSSHVGDADTYLSFEDDLVNLVAGGKSVIKLDWGGSNNKIQINNTNVDLDLQVMADDGAVILHTDAGTNRVGINNTTPQASLHVSGNLFVSGSNGHITASGNISSSLTSSAAYLYSSNNAEINTNLTVGNRVTSNYGTVNYSFTVNESGHAGGDFRVEGDTDTYLIFSDASADKVSIGKNIPVQGAATSLLDVDGDITATHLTASGNISVGEYISHIGDTDTFIQFDSTKDRINIEAGGENMIYIVEGSGGTQANKVTINNDLTDVDFQVKGDNDEDLFRTDALNDRVGIGVDMSEIAPTSKLHVAGDIFASGSNGNITASANISASGDLIVNNISASGNIIGPLNSDFDIKSDRSIRLYLDQDSNGAAEKFTVLNGGGTVRFQVQEDGKTSIGGDVDAPSNFVKFLTGNVTASGAISASGDLIANTLQIDGAQVDFTGLPTSDSGLPVGRLWNDSGTVKIKQ